jgi:hypothetical protein
LQIQCIDSLNKRIDGLFLADNADGWVGCNIVLKQIPEEGRIFIVRNEKEIPQEEEITEKFR